MTAWSDTAKRRALEANQARRQAAIPVIDWAERVARLRDMLDEMDEKEPA